MADQHQSPTAGVPSTVLIVDDDEDVRIMVRGVLQEAGYRIMEAADGETALATLQHCSERLVVLLDVLLPQLDGAALLGMVARHHQMALHNAFVVMTGKPIVAFPVLRRLAQDLGARILPKPFDIDSLLDAVAQAANTIAICPSSDDPAPQSHR